MALWFVGVGWLLVWAVFGDSAIDYRLVAAGVLLPDVVDAAVGGTRYAHTLVFSVVLLAVVVIATQGRRRLRRRLLALPIGAFTHLLLDGMWTRTHVFWWPLFGASFGSDTLPSLSRPALLVGSQELVGLAALAWCWGRFDLADAARRSAFARTGRLSSGR